MEIDRFDGICRSPTAGASRRDVARALGGFSLAGILAPLLGLADADAKKKKRKHKHKKKCKKCGPCAKCKKGKCKPKAAGTPCGDGQQCFPNGECVACDVCASGCPFSSLAEAIAYADAGATLRLCAETYGGLITIDKSLSLIGAGDGEDGTILDGQGSGKVVTVASGAAVGLEGLRITGGNTAGDGGGIFNDIGSLTLTGCTVTGNAALFGGGIDSVGTLTLTDSTVSGNTAEARGGGIYNNGTVTLNGTSSVTGNDPDDCVNGIFGTGCP